MWRDVLPVPPCVCVFQKVALERRWLEGSKGVSDEWRGLFLLNDGDEYCAVKVIGQVVGRD